MTSSKTPREPVVMHILDERAVKKSNSSHKNMSEFVYYSAYQQIEKELEIVKRQLEYSRDWLKRHYLSNEEWQEYDTELEQIRTEVNHSKSKE